MKKTKAFIFALITLLFLQVIATPGVAEAASKMPKGTTIAGVSVSGLTDAEIKQTLETEIAVWQSGEDFVLQSEYENFRVPKTVITFDLEATIKNLDAKTKRQLSTFFLKPKNVSVPLEAMINQADETYQTLDAIDYIALDESLVSLVDLARTLGSGEGALVYVPGKEMQLESVTEVSLPIEEGMSEAVLKQLITTLHDYTVEPNSPFFLLETIEIHDNLKKSPEELSFVASALYNAFLQTDFTMVERHAQLTVPKYAKSGTDAYVNYKMEKDLIVLNESEFSYKITMQQKDGKLVTKLETFPNDFTYKFTRENKKKIKPRTLYRYDLTLRPGQTKEVEKGKKGEAIEVHRATYESGNEINTELISIDVYLPEPKIIAVSTDEVISNDGEKLIGNETTDGSRDVIVDNGKGTGTSTGLNGMPRDTVLYTREEAQTLIDKFKKEIEAEGDKANSEIMKGIEKERLEMEKAFEKELKRVEKEREKLIERLEKIDLELGKTEDEKAGMEGYLEAFEETLAEFPELAEDPEFEAVIEQIRATINFTEQGDVVAAQEAAERASEMYILLFEDGKNIDFLLVLVSKLEEKAADYLSVLKLDQPLVAAKQTIKSSLDYEELTTLEDELTLLTTDVQDLKAEIKASTDKKDTKLLKKLLIQKEEELAETEEAVSEEVTKLYNEIARGQAFIQEELTRASKTIQQIEEAYEEAHEELLQVQEIRSAYPTLDTKDYHKLVKRLIKFSKTDKLADPEAYERRAKRIQKTSYELFTHFNNDTGNYFLNTLELQTSVNHYGLTFGSDNGMQYYPYFDKEASSLSDYQIISRDILSHVYQR